MKDFKYMLFDTLFTLYDQLAWIDDNHMMLKSLVRRTYLDRGYWMQTPTCDQWRKDFIHEKYNDVLRRYSTSLPRSVSIIVALQLRTFNAKPAAVRLRGIQESNIIMSARIMNTLTSTSASTTSTTSITSITSTTSYSREACDESKWNPKSCDSSTTSRNSAASDGHQKTEFLQDCANIDVIQCIWGERWSC